MSEQGVHFETITHGERVVAVSCTGGDDYILIFGSGIYQCDDIVGKEAVGPASALARFQQLSVPKIQLDDGNVVWGTECHMFRDGELKQVLNESPGLVGMRIIDLMEVRAKAPNFICINMFIPPNREAQCLPLPVSNDTFQMMEMLESLGRSLHLEGEFLSYVKQFTIMLTDNKEAVEIEIVTSSKLKTPGEDTIRRLLERAYKRLMPSA